VFLQNPATVIPQLIETQKPDFIFYLAGVDILPQINQGNFVMP
jgi:hypothetical protein